MNVYLIRHGETDANLHHYHAGWAPLGLTDKGFAQAKATGQLVKGIAFDRLYCSDLLRTRQTFSAIFGSAPHEESELIREVDVSAMLGHTPAEMAERYGEDYLAARRAWDFEAFGCESKAHFTARVAQFMRNLEQVDARNVCVVTHGGVMKVMAALVLQVSAEKAKVQNENCSVSVLSYTKEDGWSIKRWNWTKEL